MALAEEATTPGQTLVLQVIGLREVRSLLTALLEHKGSYWYFFLSADGRLHAGCASMMSQNDMLRRRDFDSFVFLGNVNTFHIEPWLRSLLVPKETARS